MRRWLCIGSIALTMLAVAACATVPDASEALEQSQDVRISTEEGWLGYRASQALIDRLGKSARSGDFLEAHLRVEEAVSGAPLVAGNDVEVFIDGPSTYDAM